MKAIFDQFDKVADFPHDRRGRVHRQDGLTLVRIYDPSEAKAEYVTDALTNWDQVPGLKETALQAYLALCTSPGIDTHMTRHFFAGYFKRMSDILAVLGMEDRTPETLSFYDCEEVIDHIASLQLSTPKDALLPLRAIVDEIWNDASLDGRRDPNLHVRRAPFADAGSRRGNREVLPDAVFGDIYARAAADVARTMAELGTFWAFIEARSAPSGGCAPHKPSLLECAAWVKDRFGDHLPSLEDLEAVDRALWRHVKWGFGWKSVVRLIHPTIHDLIPFMALLGCQTLFNKAVLTELGLNDIDRQEMAGTRRIVFTPLKKRAGRQQLRSFAVDDALDNPSVAVDFLVQATAGLRTMVPAAFENRLFLFWSLNPRNTDQMQSGASAFYGVNTGSGSEDTRFTYYWNLWCKENKFGEVPFSSLRVTGLNLAHRAFAGDIRAVAALASHSSPDIFDRHYKSAHSRAGNDRRLAKAMMLRDRMIGTGGKADPTKRLRGEGAEAATPGFGCLDPCASPIPGQREGRPCTAYGQCPGCPLATTDSGVPANLVRMKQLDAEYTAARGYLAPHYWRDKFHSSCEALRREWLPAFSDPAVIKAASRMQASPLPPLG